MAYGDIIPSHAYYLVKLAQEKAELKDQTLVLTKKIKREESDLKGKLKMKIYLHINYSFLIFRNAKSSRHDEVLKLKL